MVWAIFAPRFVFACLFTLICLTFWLLGTILEMGRESNPDSRPAPNVFHSNRRPHLISIFITLSCIASSASAYATLTIVDAENVRGKSNFDLRHNELVDAVGWWTVAQQKCDDGSLHSSSLVIDHGTKPSSFFQPLDGTNGDDTNGIAILFSGPNEKADDVIARDVGKIASESMLNNIDLRVIRIVTSDQGLRSRCRVAFDEAENKKRKKSASSRQKGSSRRRRGGASSSKGLDLEFMPSIAFLSQLKQELVKHRPSNPQEIMVHQASPDIVGENIVNELHQDIELRGKLHQIETSLREAQKSSSKANKKRILKEKGRKISHQIFNSRDSNGQTILERILKDDTLGGGEMDVEKAILSGWHSRRCEAGRAELTGDRMLEAECLRRQLEKLVADEQSPTSSIRRNVDSYSPSEFHYLCHQHFHGGRPADVPYSATRLFDTAVESMRLVIVSGAILSKDEQLPVGDILLHLGNFTTSDDGPKSSKRKRNDKYVEELDEWFSSQPHPVKLALRGTDDPPAAAQVELPKSKAMYLDRPTTIPFGGGNILMTLVPYCTERDLSSSWRRLPHTFDVLVCRQVFHEAQMIANRVELMFSGTPQLWLAGDISRGVYEEYEQMVAKSSISMRKTSVICGQEWGSKVASGNLEPFVVDIEKQMGSDDLKFDIVN